MGSGIKCSKFVSYENLPRQAKIAIYLNGKHTIHQNLWLYVWANEENFSYIILINLKMYQVFR